MMETRYIVAPYVGAWIETIFVPRKMCPGLSHPMWVRGLKLLIITVLTSHQVAPYVGAWIETKLKARYYTKRTVAPYVGAWIETF